jgi:DNA modification methylase
VSAALIRGDALTIPLADQSVDLIVTSPPYFALRSYTDACGTCGGHAPGPFTGPSESSTLAGNGHVGGGPKSKLLGVGTADPDCPECDGSGRGHYPGQIGSEPTPAEFIDALIGVTAECVRVLKPSGSLFVNLGDKYSGAQAQNIGGENRAGDSARTWAQTNPANTGIRNKSLMGLPWRYALACIDDLGLILRAEIIWSKPNGLPESVQDRVRRSHEQFFHFTLEPRYYSAVDEIREAHSPNTAWKDPGRYSTAYGDGIQVMHSANDSSGLRTAANPLGKLPGSVWQIPTEPLRVPDHLPQHFAAFPSEWPRRIILGWSPSGICVECGFLLGSTYDKGMLGVRGADHRGSHRPPGQQAEGSEAQSVLLQDLLEPVELEEPGDYEVPPPDHQGLRGGLEASSPDGAEVGLHDGAPAGDGRAPRSDAGAVGGRPPQERGQDGQPDREPRSDDEIGPRPPAEATAQTVPVSPLRRPDPVVRELESCPNCGGSDWRDPVILDPFVGTGTVPATANALGRYGVGIDLSADYLKLARWRCQDPGLRAKVLRVDKPAPEVPGQMALL